VKSLLSKLLAAVAVFSLATAAHAQDFPKHPITMIVPFAAGGTSDVIARTVAEQMGTALGQTIVIENVAGAGGSTALARAARAEADGYTIAIGNAGTNAAAYTIYPMLPFKADAFVPIAMVAKTFGIEVNKDVVRRVLAADYRPERTENGTSWLTLLGHTKDSLWSLDLFRTESILLRSHWVLVVMDQFSRLIIGFGVQAIAVDGPGLCRMFNKAISGSGLPTRLSPKSSATGETLAKNPPCLTQPPDFENSATARTKPRCMA